MDELYQIKLMSRAVRDLDRIYTYIAEKLSEPDTALRLVEKIESEILSLRQFPDRCAIRKTGAYANRGYRQLFVKNYTVIFRVDEAGKAVLIVTVRYSPSQF